LRNPIRGIESPVLAPLGLINNAANPIRGIESFARQSAWLVCYCGIPSGELKVKSMPI